MLNALNAQDLNAFAALCGSAATPTSSGGTTDNNALSSYALIAQHFLQSQQLQAQQVQGQGLQSQQVQAQQAQQLQAQQVQLQQAQQLQAQQVQAQQAQQLQAQQVQAQQLQEARAAAASRQQAEAARQAALSTVSPDVLRTYCATAGLRHDAASSMPTNHPDPNAEKQAREIALKIFMAQQQQHQTQRQSPPGIALHRSPAAQQLVTHPAPSYTAAVEVSQVAPAKQYTRVVTNSSPHNPAPMPVAHHTVVSTVNDKKEVSKPWKPSKKANPPPKKRHSRAGSSQGGLGSASLKSVMSEWEDKKQAKRAANRFSAHLSRKRKKMFMQTLKEENDELRRKEQILQSIPDLIVAFDSSGEMTFVSDAITRMLDFTSQELQDTSFWDRLTQDSVQMVKSAFMDALAIKRPEDEDSTPLWNGESRTVTLVDRTDEGLVLASLKGVVQFSAESPECVCTIRREESAGTSAADASHRISDVDSSQGNLLESS